MSSTATFSVSILTLFPGFFSGPLNESLLHKATEKNLLSFSLINFRDFAEPPHFSVDDTPYGGGAGMILRSEPLVKAVRHVQGQAAVKAPVILLSASGKKFDQTIASRLSKGPGMILICGRYEGVDERVVDLVVDEEISIGNFVIMGGEAAALVVIEAVTRLIPGVLGNSTSIEHESFSTARDNGSEQTLLEAPQYTKPAEFAGLKVPEVLQSGNHAKIKAFRAVTSREKTAKNRPDLLKKS